jgi:hypothetical protein
VGGLELSEEVVGRGGGEREGLTEGAFQCGEKGGLVGDCVGACDEEVGAVLLLVGEVVMVAERAV